LIEQLVESDIVAIVYHAGWHPGIIKWDQGGFRAATRVNTVQIRRKGEEIQEKDQI
jgi:hypothetical protein